MNDYAIVKKVVDSKELDSLDDLKEKYEELINPGLINSFINITGRFCNYKIKISDIITYFFFSFYFFSFFSLL